MDKKKGLMVACAVFLCLALAVTTLVARENPGKGEQKKEGRGRGGRGRGNRKGMGSEAMQAEFERHREVMEGLQEAVQALKKEIKQAVQAARQGEGKPDREEIKEITKSYEAEARDLATSLVEARIEHQENMVSILKAEKNNMIERLTKRILFHRGKGPSGLGNRGRGTKGDGTKGRGRKGRGGHPDE